MSFLLGLVADDLAVVALETRCVQSPTAWTPTNWERVSDGEPFELWDHVARAPRLVPAFPRHVHSLRGGWVVGSSVGACYYRIADALADVDAWDAARCARIVRASVEAYAQAVPDPAVARSLGELGLIAVASPFGISTIHPNGESELGTECV